MIIRFFLTLALVWVCLSLLFFFTFDRDKRKRSHDICSCGRFYLKDKDYQRTKHIVHKRDMCTPSIETIW